MIELKNKYINKNAVIIFGGPSILDNNYDLSLLSGKDNIIFLESKALTPQFVKFGIEPDFFFMPYPEKTRTNSLQYMFIQALSCNFDLKKYLKKKYIDEWVSFKDRFGEYADIWRIEYPHKRYRIKSNVVLDNSPLSLLKKFPNMGLITYDVAYDADGISQVNLPNKVFKFTHSDENCDDIDRYFNPVTTNGKLTLANMGFMNSAAISLYPVLNSMGFKKVFFIGMDMSYLGSFEFSAPYIFKTMKDFGVFFDSSRASFTYTFPAGYFRGIRRFCSSVYNDLRNMNTRKLFSLSKFQILNKDFFGFNGRYMRTKEDMRHVDELFKKSDKYLEFINIHDAYKYSAQIPSIKNITFQDFIDKNY
jgi:hypothetical protein